jgi:hypothetical protein
MRECKLRRGVNRQSALKQKYVRQGAQNKGSVYVYVFLVILTINSDYFSEQRSQIGLWWKQTVTYERKPHMQSIIVVVFKGLDCSPFNFPMNCSVSNNLWPWNTVEDMQMMAVRTHTFDTFLTESVRIEILFHLITNKVNLEMQS